MNITCVFYYITLVCTVSGVSHSLADSIQCIVHGYGPAVVDSGRV